MREACHGIGSKRSAAPDHRSCTNPTRRLMAPEAEAGAEAYERSCARARQL